MNHLLVADDHPLYRMALTQAIRGFMPDARIGEAEDHDSVMAYLQANPDTDIVLLDLHMPGCHGLMGLASIRAEHPGVAVIVISAHENPATIRRSLDYGAVGYLTKRTGLADLKNSLTAVLSCQEWLPASVRKSVAQAELSADDHSLDEKLASLSPQQFKVLTRVTRGLLNKQIADELGIQERTVKAHMSAIFEKLGVKNRTQAGVLLRSLELADPNSALP
ncbi:DNA-binding response regulator [Arenimonas maotaiensis]|jgi:DNA-binding NarL/FixJ family response regulator|uniref:DNA-binding response regulator n=1 Tax=Arenimonas maotaiensis TaxID=1446479 RepID=A0A917CEM1_9GAMM|nr:response regulator transcription factor [Arenimonas maotaiensis]MCC6757428.1 response regulator transcription factor [Arenimonas sp.]GGF85403.1 DNA-binding response regulator [Arenimonas maotaiensis]